jgi:hypothetical protein
VAIEVQRQTLPEVEVVLEVDVQVRLARVARIADAGDFLPSDDDVSLLHAD